MSSALKMPKNFKKNDGTLDVIDIISSSINRSFEIGKTKTLDDLGSGHLPMISIVKFNNNETSLHNLIKLYHKIDKIKALNLLNNQDQQNCKDKKEIGDLFNTITENLKNIQESIPKKRFEVIMSLSQKALG